MNHSVLELMRGVDGLVRMCLGLVICRPWRMLRSGEPSRFRSSFNGKDAPANEPGHYPGSENRSLLLAARQRGMLVYKAGGVVDGDGDSVVTDQSGADTLAVDGDQMHNLTKRASSLSLI